MDAKRLNATVKRDSFPATVPRKIVFPLKGFSWFSFIATFSGFPTLAFRYDRFIMVKKVFD